MHYPPGFSDKARAAVEAELIRAGRMHDKRKGEWHPDWTFSEALSLREYILSVFLTYAREAIELGKRGVWTVDTVRARALEGLRLITIRVSHQKGYDNFIERGGGEISSEAQREFETTTQWEQFEDQMLALAESKQHQSAEVSTEGTPTGPSNPPRSNVMEQRERAEEKPSPLRRAWERLRALRRQPLPDERAAAVSSPQLRLSADPAPARQNAPPTPNAYGASKWESIELVFLSETSLQIYIDGKPAAKRNFDELGFVDGRRDEPNTAWRLLTRFAELGGVVGTPQDANMEWRKVEKQVQAIRQALREMFSISDDPLPFIRGGGYQARFGIRCAPSYHG